MSKIIEVIEGLKNLISLSPASAKDIENVEKELDLKLAKDYKEYIQKYGAILADDIELTGIAKSANRNVVTVTKREWKANDKISHDKYVIENVGIDGIIAWQDASGKIYESSPEKEAVQIADDLAEYLETK